MPSFFSCSCLKVDPIVDEDKEDGDDGGRARDEKEEVIHIFGAPSVSSVEELWFGAFGARTVTIP